MFTCPMYIRIHSNVYNFLLRDNVCTTKMNISFKSNVFIIIIFSIVLKLNKQIKIQFV